MKKDGMQVVLRAFSERRSTSLLLVLRETILSSCTNVLKVAVIGSPGALERLERFTRI